MRYLKMILLSGMLAFLCACGRQEKAGGSSFVNPDPALSEMQTEGISTRKETKSGEAQGSEKEEPVRTEKVRMVKVNDKLYVDTGEISSVAGRCGVMDFSFDSSVETGEPTENNQTNFGTGYEGQVGARENRIEIFFNDEWHVFAYHENDFAGVFMEVTEVTDHSLKLELTNETDLDVQYGDDYLLEVLDEESGGWAQVSYLDPDIAFHDIAYPVGKGEVSTWEVDWTDMYGTLDAGEYRIVKKVHDFRGTGDYTTYMLSAAFTIQ